MAWKDVAPKPPRFNGRQIDNLEPTAPESVARVNVNIRFKQGGLKAIDSLRGGWSRSEYVRQATADAVKAGKRGPKVTDL